MLEEDLKKEEASWGLIQSNFVTADYLDSLGLDEELKREIKNEKI
jgi:hypothetical protein